MTLQKGKFYTTDTSDILIFIRDIFEFDETHTTVNTLIFKKSNKMLLEKSKTYKLEHKKIKEWKEFEDAEV